MANLQIKGIEDDLYHAIKKMAAAENRSVSQQILFLVKSYMAKKGTLRFRQVACRGSDRPSRVMAG